ncbi:hypothetical protein FHX37_0041 [Haloactinospora alba]|uniref:Uncharacterized protein n=2 Tax=Haloactinospora alba TaxID=405555 RepID=A0A543NEL3_9ACTN|nr:hypothetical protein FHX37_0041 [Haloactinospora alba]
MGTAPGRPRDREAAGAAADRPRLVASDDAAQAFLEGGAPPGTGAGGTQDTGAASAAPAASSHGSGGYAERLAALPELPASRWRRVARRTVAGWFPRADR